MKDIIISLVNEVSPVKKLEDNDDLVNKAGFDSLKMLFLVMKVEERFNITIADGDLNIENFTSVNTIASLVEKYQK